MKHTLTKGKAAFLDYYSQALPQFSTVADLEKYLTTKNPPVLLPSPVHHDELHKLWSSSGLSWEPLSWFQPALTWPPEVPLGTPLPGYSQGWLYSLNPASLLPVLALAPHTGDTILDASAAPGGKTLALAGLIDTSQSTLIANDVSGPRFKRLRTTLKLFGYPHIPTWRLPIQSISKATDLKFDKILLDAPCSSEKHVFNSKRHLKIWSEKRITILSRLQVHLIESLLPVLKPGGLLIYSTCALTPLENESVIGKILDRHPNFRLSELPKNLPVHRPGLPGHGLPDHLLHHLLRLNDPHLPLDLMFIAAIRRVVSR